MSSNTCRKTKSRKFGIATTCKAHAGNLALNGDIMLCTAGGISTDGGR